MRIRQRKKHEFANSQGNIQPQFQQRPFATQSLISNQTKDLETLGDKSQKPGFNFAEIPIFPSDQSNNLQSIQAKLTIGTPGDKYEQEADAVAHRVVNEINSPQAQRQEEKTSESPLIDSRSSLQKYSLGEPTKIQAKGYTHINPQQSSENIETKIASAQGKGNSLDPSLQNRMEKAIGADFSEVRIHNDFQADNLNRTIQAKAFTTGQDIFFRQGEYQPNSRSGQELIAHELTHVAQQKPQVVQRSQDKMNISQNKGTPDISRWDYIDNQPFIADELRASVAKGPFRDILFHLSREEMKQKPVTDDEVKSLFYAYISQRYKYKSGGGTPTWKNILEGNREYMMCGYLAVGFNILVETLCSLRQLFSSEIPTIEKRFTNTPAISYTTQFIDERALGNLLEADKQVLKGWFYFKNHAWSVINGIKYDLTLGLIDSDRSYPVALDSNFSEENPRIRKVNIDNEWLWFDCEADGYVPGTDMGGYWYSVDPWDLMGVRKLNRQFTNKEPLGDNW